MYSNGEILLRIVKENKARIVVIMLLVIGLSVALILLKNKNEMKIYKGFDYVFTKDVVKSNNSESRLPYINLDTEEARIENESLANYFYSLTAEEGIIFNYEVTKEKHIYNLKITIDRSSNGTYPTYEYISCAINAKNKKMSCVY